MSNTHLPSVFYEYIISHAFNVVISTNAGPLSLPPKEAKEMANIYNQLYPGADFFYISKANPLAEAYAQYYLRLCISPGGRLDWSILSKLEWLERLAGNTNMLAWLSANCRQI